MQRCYCPVFSCHAPKMQACLYTEARFPGCSMSVESSLITVAMLSYVLLIYSVYQKCFEICLTAQPSYVELKWVG